MLEKMRQFDEKLNLWSKDFKKITWNNTINSYAENLTKTKIILNDLLTEEEYFRNLKDEINGIQSEIDKYLSTVSNPEYQIAIVGAVKAGKSTLINALLGYNLVSVDVTPETATLTKIKASDKSYIKTSFYTKDEWIKIWNQANNPKKKAEIFLKEYKEISAETVKNNYVGKETIVFYSEDNEKLKSEIKKWTSSKAKEHYFVKEIEIGLSSLNLNKQVCFVDTPGLNDIVEYRSNITLDYIDRANAIIVCVNAQVLKQEDYLMIAKVFQQARHKKDKIYILGTQLDKLNSLEDWENQKNLWKEQLSGTEHYNDKKLIDNNVIGISAHIYNNLDRLSDEDSDDILGNLMKLKLLSRKDLSNIDKLNSQEFKNTVANFTNIEKIKTIVFKTLVNNYNEIIFKDSEEKYKITRDRINSFKNSHIKSTQDLLNATKLGKSELEKAIDDSNQKVKEMKNKIENITKNINNINHNFKFDFDQLEEKFNEIKGELKNIKID